MGALRKTTPEFQPTQIIVLPLGQARPRESEEVGLWERFASSPVGDLLLFEIKAFAGAALALSLLGIGLMGLYSAQSSTDGQLISSTGAGFLSEMSAPASVQLPHQLN